MIQTERASLKDGKLHDTLRIYDLVTIRQAVNAHDQSQQVKPVWSFERVGKAPEGNAEFLSNLKWLPDSSAVAFLSQEEQYHCRLYLARLASKSIVPLTASRDDVLGFDVRDMSHYVFTVASRETDASLRRVLHASFRVGTGHPLYDRASQSRRPISFNAAIYGRRTAGNLCQYAIAEQARPSDSILMGTSPLRCPPKVVPLLLFAQSRMFQKIGRSVSHHHFRTARIGCELTIRI